MAPSRSNVLTYSSLLSDVDGPSLCRSVKQHFYAAAATAAAAEVTEAEAEAEAATATAAEAEGLTLTAAAAAAAAASAALYLLLLLLDCCTNRYTAGWSHLKNVPDVNDGPGRSYSETLAHARPSK